MRLRQIVATLIRLLVVIVSGLWLSVVGPVWLACYLLVMWLRNESWSAKVIWSSMIALVWSIAWGIWVPWGIFLILFGLWIYQAWIYILPLAKWRGIGTAGLMSIMIASVAGLDWTLGIFLWWFAQGMIVWWLHYLINHYPKNSVIMTQFKN